MALTGKNNEEQIWNYLRAKGMSEHGAAGCMGNLYAESALRPNNLQDTYEKQLGYTDDTYVAAVDSGKYTNFVKDSAGFGLAQWTYWSRKQNLLNFAKAKNKSIGDLEMQLDFLWKELSESYTDVLDSMKTATSVLKASNDMLLHFEKPANRGILVQKQRAEFGQKYYDKYSSGVDKKPAQVTGTTQTIAPAGGRKMKYTSSNKPLVCMMTQSACYKGTSRMKPVGVLWHSTGANNPNLSRYVQPDDNAPNRNELIALIGKNKYGNDLNHSTEKIGVNGWVGKLADGTVTSIQSLPWDFRPWGCSRGVNGSCNDGWIQFEICEDGLSDSVYFNKVYEEACQLTAYLCRLYNIDPNGHTVMNDIRVPNILCHADSYALGLGSNHGDVMHWFPKHGKSMDTVRKDVTKLMGGSSSSVLKPETPSTSEPQLSSDVKAGDVVKIASGAVYYDGRSVPAWVRSKAWIVDSIRGDRAVIDKSEDGKNAICSPINVKFLTKTKVEFEPYKVKVTADALNIRKGAGTDYAVAGVIKDKGVYTIVAESNGKGASKYGKLKSGAGWISLDYTKRVY